MSNDNIYLNNCKTIPFEKLGLVTDYVLEKSFVNFISEELLCAVEAVIVNSRFFLVHVSTEIKYKFSF